MIFLFFKKVEVLLTTKFTITIPKIPLKSALFNIHPNNLVDFKKYTKNFFYFFTITKIFSQNSICYHVLI